MARTLAVMARMRRLVIEEARQRLAECLQAEAVAAAAQLLASDALVRERLLADALDADDRVVGLQFVCENPSSKMYYPKEDFRTYNFINNRRKSSTTLKVGCEVTAVSDEVLMVESWLYDERRDKSLEIVRWYLPKRIANFLRHVIEARLDLAE